MSKKYGSGWNGNGSFTYDVERFLDNETNNYLTESELPENFDENRYEYTSVELTIVGSGYYTPAYTRGLPEDCYPADGDLEIESITGPNNKDWSSLITDSERDSIENELQNYLENNSRYDGPDYDGPDERDYYDYDY